MFKKILAAVSAIALSLGMVAITAGPASADPGDSLLVDGGFEAQGVALGVPVGSLGPGGEPWGYGWGGPSSPCSWTGNPGVPGGAWTGGGVDRTEDFCTGWKWARSGAFFGLVKDRQTLTQTFTATANGIGTLNWFDANRSSWRGDTWYGRPNPYSVTLTDSAGNVQTIGNYTSQVYLGLESNSWINAGDDRFSLAGKQGWFTRSATGFWLEAGTTYTLSFNSLAPTYIDGGGVERIDDRTTLIDDISLTATSPGAFLSGVGSSQTDDVMAGVATVIPQIANYSSLGSATVATKTNGLAFTRPADSVAGQVALSNSVAGGTLGGVVMGGYVDFARSSIGPSSALPGTALTFVPFAKDAVTFAVNEASDFPRDIPLGSAAQDAASPTLFTLRNIYRGTITGYTDRNLVTVPIRASLPAVGTELRAFWLGKLGLTESEVGSSVLSAPSGPAGEGMTQLTGPGDIAPVSVASYLAQGNHNSLPTSVVERRGITQLGYIDTVKPYVTTASGVTANPAFPLSRLVYSVIATARLSGTSFQDQALASAFAGPTSQLCSASAMIAAYGYATIGSLCGNTTLYQQALRLS